MPLRSHRRQPGLGRGREARAWVPAALPDWKCGGFLWNPCFLFGFSAKGWRNRMGTGLVAVWHRTGTFLKVVGAGSDSSVVQFLWDTSSALSSLPLPLGRVSNTNKPKARSPSQVCAKGREEERAFPSFYFQFLFVSNINGRENGTDLPLASEEQAITHRSPTSTPGHCWGQPDVAGVETPKMELEKMIHCRRRGPRRLELSVLADGGPRSSANPLSFLRGARARPVVALQKWEEKMLGTRTYQAPRRFHEARQEPPGTLRPGFLPTWWALAEKTEFLGSRSCRTKKEKPATLSLAALPDQL